MQWGALAVGAFSGKEVGGLNGERLTVGDPRHEWYVDWLVLQTK